MAKSLNCKDCKFAEWEKLPSGRISPNANGKCNAPIKTIGPISKMMVITGGHLRINAPYYAKNCESFSRK